MQAPARLLLFVVLACACSAAPSDIRAYMPPLQGRRLRCARFIPDEDGFIRFTEAALSKIGTVKDGSSMKLQPNDVIGFNVDTLEVLAGKALEQYNTTVTFELYYYKVPSAVLANRTAFSSVVVEHVAGRFDCILESLQIITERAMIVNFMQPNMPFGYILVAPGSQPRRQGLLETVLIFLKPFSWETWLAILAFWSVSSIAVLVFESQEVYGEFGDRARQQRSGLVYGGRAPSKTWLDKLAYSGFKAWLLFLRQTMLMPVSAAGRLYSMALVFICLCLVASYTAKLASIFTTAALPAPGVRSIEELIAIGGRLCVKNSAVHVAFAKNVYPKAKLKAIPGDERDVLDAVYQGHCTAGMSSNVHMAYFLSTNASWCDLRIVGQPLSFSYYGIAFRRSGALDPVVQSLNVLLTDAMERSELLESKDRQFPPSEKRQVCGALLEAGASREAAGLGLVQVAGLFLLGAILLAASTLLHFTVDDKRRRRERHEARSEMPVALTRSASLRGRLAVKRSFTQKKKPNGREDV